MTRHHAFCFALVCACALTCGLAFSQTPEPAPAGTAPAADAQPQRPRGPRPNPVNIKALPKNISGDDLIKLMHEYTGDLGVGCDFCHAQDPVTRHSNYASDANPMKETARFMITMTADLNDKYLARMPNREFNDTITCATCHRGEKHPSVFVPAPRTQPARPPAVAAPAPTAAPPPAR